MRQVNLQEYQQSEPLALSHAELGVLLRESKTLGLSVAPAAADGDKYILKPDSKVGAVGFDNFSVLIQPKIGVPQLLSLACYAIGKVRFRREEFEFPEETALPDVLAIALASHARKAFARGLLHGYRVEEEALHTVRGGFGLESR